MKTQWNRPQCTEIKMDAEIGSYQEDDGDRRGDGPDAPRDYAATTIDGCGTTSADQ